jgi:proteasome lid subunit RPN8/RPN11
MKGSHTPSMKNIARTESIPSTNFLNCPPGTYCFSSYDYRKPPGTVNGIPLLRSCRSYLSFFGNMKAIDYIIYNEWLVPNKLMSLEPISRNDEQLLTPGESGLRKGYVAGGTAYQPNDPLNGNNFRSLEPSPIESVRESTTKVSEIVRKNDQFKEQVIRAKRAKTQKLTKATGEFMDEQYPSMQKDFAGKQYPDMRAMAKKIVKDKMAADLAEEQYPTVHAMTKKVTKGTKETSEFVEKQYPTAKIVSYNALPPAVLPEAPPKVEKRRDVNIPQKIVEMFANAAHCNTQRRKETCGILAGKEIAGTLVISTIIIPPQSGDEVSCTMDDDVTALLDYQLQKELMQIGWIHTHVGIEPFMSSADLHTQHSFSLQMMESVAIVVSPKIYHRGARFRCEDDYSVGLYRLTKSGARVLAECEDKSMFHPHDERKGPLYDELRQRDGIEIFSAQVIVSDLRSK